MKRSDPYSHDPKRTHLLVVSQLREPFSEAVLAGRGRLTIRFFSQPMEALALALQNRESTILFLDHSLIFRQEAGAIRLLDQANDTTHLVILLSPDGPAADDTRALLQGTGVHYTTPPTNPEAVLELVETFSGPLHPWDELGAPVIDLVKGVADAINNPLAGLSGFIQLLEIQMGPGPEDAVAATFTQVKKALAILARVAADLEVAGGTADMRVNQLCVSQVLLDINHNYPQRAMVTNSTIPQELTIAGDQEVVTRAVNSLLDLGLSIAAEGVTLNLSAEKLGLNTVIAVSIPATIPSRWRADKTFHPFFLSHSLQTPEIGLAPAVAAGACRAMGGKADAKWHQDGTLILSLTLPSTPAAPNNS